MTPRRPCDRPGGNRRGAALIVVLILLLALTILGLSATGTATLELLMAGNDEAAELAFQAAETGIEMALAGPIDAAMAPGYRGVAVGGGRAEFDVTIACIGTSRVPDRAFSEHGAARAIHYLATAEGRGPRNAVSRHSQGAYLIGPDQANARLDPDAAGGGC